MVMENRAKGSQFMGEKGVFGLVFYLFHDFLRLGKDDGLKKAWKLYPKFPCPNSNDPNQNPIHLEPF